MRKRLTRKSLQRKLDKQFSLMVRARDADLPCVSCGQWKSDKQAGHYFKREILATRWHPQNVHGECAKCNGFDPHHYVGYSKTLEECCGIGTIERLAALAKLHWKPLPDQLERLILACGNPYDYESEWFAVQREFAPTEAYLTSHAPQTSPDMCPVCGGKAKWSMPCADLCPDVWHREAEHGRS